MGWYLAWVLLHLGCLLIGSDEIFSEGGYYNDFWPFGKDDIGDYDFREFLVYTIFPLAILVIWSMVRTQSNAESDETNPK